MQIGASLGIGQISGGNSPFTDKRIELEGGRVKPMTIRQFDYRICDVFTGSPLQGNQLAVFLDAGSLTDGEMQAVAREMNLSETTFIVRREPSIERERGVRVRIFTTQEELPFAGHPTLGTSSTIRKEFAEYAGAKTVLLDLNGGRVPVVFANERNLYGNCYGEMTQPDPIFGTEHDTAEIAQLLGLGQEDCAELPLPQTVSTGLPYCVVLLRSVYALGRLRVDLRAAERYFSASDAKFFYVIAPDGPGVWRARMQFYNGEDPATGSAAGCAIAYFVRHQIVAPGEQIHIRQGVEIGRPSDLYVSANSTSGKIAEVRVGGSTVHVAKGRLFLE
jgi:trans-2,3-dihydro-3-hydroxyanthranilate isomerase